MMDLNDAPKRFIGVASTIDHDATIAQRLRQAGFEVHVFLLNKLDNLPPFDAIVVIVCGCCEDSQGYLAQLEDAVECPLVRMRDTAPVSASTFPNFLPADCDDQELLGALEAYLSIPA